MRTLLQGGCVLTMDDALGDLERGDVLIEGDRIAAVGARLDVDADTVVDCTGRIVLPGLIDGHIHLWQTPLRGLAGEGWAGEYFGIVHPLSGRYRPQDMHAATYGGAIELLMHGVTTVFDFCHSVNSPEHADASVDALRAAGIRALFGYSFRDRPEVATRAFARHEERIADARRVHAGLDGGLVGMAIALNNLAHVDAPTNAAELRCARELGVLATIHSLIPWEIAELHARGLLGPDVHWVHCNAAADEELALLAEHGGVLAITPEVEIAYEGLYPITGRAVAHGVPVTFGVDVVSAVAADPLMQMRSALQAQRMLDAQTDHLQGRSPRRSAAVPAFTSRDVLRLGTAGAADALGLGDRVGRLAAGKQADVLVLSTAPYGLSVGDPAAHVLLQSGRRDVEHVYVAGRERVRDGRLVDVDVARMRSGLDAAREHVLGA